MEKFNIKKRPVPGVDKYEGLTRDRTDVHDGLASETAERMDASRAFGGLMGGLNDLVRSNGWNDVWTRITQAVIGSGGRTAEGKHSRPRNQAKIRKVKQVVKHAAKKRLEGK